MSRSHLDARFDPHEPRTVGAAEQLLSVQQCAVLLAVNHKTVRRLIATGDLPALRVGRVLRIRLRDLDALCHRPDEGASALRHRASLARGSFAKRARGRL